MQKVKYSKNKIKYNKIVESEFLIDQCFSLNWLRELNRTLIALS